MADSYSNLKNNYMYGYKNRVNGFYKPNDTNKYENYKNFSNDLEDPIFTGFTLSLDMIHSPLFECGNYLDDAFTQLTDENGEKNISQGLSQKIEKQLLEKVKKTQSVDNYDDNMAIIDFEKFKNGQKIGYGIHDAIDADGITYGAVEYIYMVDKAPGSNQKSSTTAYSDIGTAQFAKKDTASSGSPDSKTQFNLPSAEEMLEKVLMDEVGGTLLNPDGTPKQTTQFQPSENAKDLVSESALALLNAKKAQQEKEEAKYSQTLQEFKKEKENFDRLAAQMEDIEDYIFEKDTNYIYRAALRLREFRDIALKLIKKDSVNGRITSDAEYYMISNHYIPELEIFLKDKQLTGYPLNLTDGEELYLDDLYRMSQHPNCAQYYDFCTSNTNLSAKYYKDACRLATINFDESVIKYIFDTSKKLFGTADAKEGALGPDGTEGLYAKYKESEEKLKRYRESQDIIDYEETCKNLDKLSDPSKLIVLDQDTLRQPDKISKATDFNNFNSITGQNESRYYNSLGDAPQSCIDMLGFIYGMKKITEYYPYIFQSVNGLSEAYNNYFKMDEPYQGSGDDKITITCYESLDMRISSMFNKYFNAAYDKKYKRERLPMNLRRFQCSIFVHDIRNFRHALNLLRQRKSVVNDQTVITSDFAEGNDMPDSKIIEVALNHLSVVEFKFFDCEIIPSETGNIFESVENAELGEQRMTQLSFSYGRCYVNFLPFNDLVNNYNTSGDNSSYGDDIVSTVKPTFTIEADNSRKPIQANEVEGNEQIKDFIERELVLNSSNIEMKEEVVDTNSGDLLMAQDMVNSSSGETIDKNIDKKLSDYYYSHGQEVYLTNMDGNDTPAFLGNVDLNDLQERILHERYIDNRYDEYKKRRALDIAMRSIAASIGESLQDTYIAYGLGNVYDRIHNHRNVTVKSNGNIEQDVKNLGDTVNLGYNDMEVPEGEDFIKEDGPEVPSDKGKTDIIGNYTFGDKIIQPNPNIYQVSETMSGKISQDTYLGKNNPMNIDVMNANKKVFGGDGIDGINDRKYGTSITDYKLSSNPDDIGSIVESEYINESPQELENVYNYREKSKIADKLGNIYNDNNLETIKDVEKIDNAFNYVDSGEMVNSIETDKPIKTEDRYVETLGNVIKKEREILETYKTKVKEDYTQKPTEKIVEKIGNLKVSDYKMEKTKKVGNAYDNNERIYTTNVNKIGNLELPDIKTENNEKVSNVYDNDDKINETNVRKISSDTEETRIPNDVREIGNVYKPLTQPKDVSEIGNLNNEINDIGVVKKIGDVYQDNPINIKDFNKLEDIL